MNQSQVTNALTAKVLMASTSFPASALDWKGLFIARLAEALARRSDIDLTLWNPPGEFSEEVKTALTPGDSRWLGKLMARGGVAHLVRTKPLRGLPTAAMLLWRLRKAYGRTKDNQLRHINWLQTALPQPLDGCPMVVTALGSDVQLLRVPGLRWLLRRQFAARPTIICPNAEWMVAPLQNAFGDLAQVVFVPFGIDPGWYAVLREPSQHMPAKWLVVSRLTRAKLGPLLEWCRSYFEGQARELHLFGPMQERIELPPWVRYHGPATPESLRDDWFPKAHGLITLSQHAEGRPQVMLEAMAASLPIIASRLPAHEDIVQHQKTGWICDEQDDLRTALATLEQPGINAHYGQSAREWVTDHIGTWDDCASRYVTIYRRLLSEGKA